MKYKIKVDKILLKPVINKENAIYWYKRINKLLPESRVKIYQLEV